MKFEKITDTKIKIILDTKDIKLHNISSENIFNNSRSSQQLLKTMLIRAEKEIGFIANKTNFENMIENYIKNYNSKNVESVSITNNPEYKLKLIDKKQETSENEILIAMQKEMIIKYHYYEIYINNQKVESVDTLEEAQTITNKIEEVDNNIKYEINK